jgi:hypothetical protein
MVLGAIRYVHAMEMATAAAEKAASAMKDGGEATVT